MRVLYASSFTLNSRRQSDAISGGGSIAAAGRKVLRKETARASVEKIPLVMQKPLETQELTEDSKEEENDE